MEEGAKQPAWREGSEMLSCYIICMIYNFVADVFISTLRVYTQARTHRTHARTHAHTDSDQFWQLKARTLCILVVSLLAGWLDVTVDLGSII